MNPAEVFANVRLGFSLAKAKGVSLLKTLFVGTVLAVVVALVVACIGTIYGGPVYLLTQLVGPIAFPAILLVPLLIGAIFRPTIPQETDRNAFVATAYSTAALGYLAGVFL